MSNQDIMITLPDGSTLSVLELREAVTNAGLRDINEIRFVEMLVAEGIIPLERVPDVIMRARANNSRIPACVISARVATEAEVAMILARLHDMQTIDLNEVLVDEAVVSLIDPVAALRHLALPVRYNDEGAVIVAMADPTSVGAREEIPRLVGAPVEFRVCPLGQVRAAIARAGQIAEHATLEAAKDDAPDVVEEDIRADAVAESGVVQVVNQIIGAAQDDKASDIHIEPLPDGTIVRYRVDGVMHVARRLPSRMHDQIISRIKVISGLKLDERRSPQDGRVTANVGRGPVDLRISTLPSIFGEAVAMRLLDPDKSRYALDRLGFSPRHREIFEAAVRRPWGATVITGPTGSGKSTTLYAAMSELNDVDRKLISVEDPVEQRIEGITQMQVNERARLTFATALRSILRSDPDIIMIGEIRDQETAKIAIESALTGHLVLSSLHTNDAPSSIHRLMDMGCEPFLIANAIELIVAQRLIRKLCTSCRIPYEVDAEYLTSLRAPAHAVAAAAERGTLTIYKASTEGCGQCGGRGYSGRTGVHEMMVLSEEIKDAITSGRSTVELREMARNQGMVTLREDCFEKVLDGVTSLDELARTLS